MCGLSVASSSWIFVLTEGEKDPSVLSFQRSVRELFHVGVRLRFPCGFPFSPYTQQSSCKRTVCAWKWFIPEHLLQHFLAAGKGCCFMASVGTSRGSWSRQSLLACILSSLIQHVLATKFRTGDNRSYFPEEKKGFQPSSCQIIRWTPAAWYNLIINSFKPAVAWLSR